MGSKIPLYVSTVAILAELTLLYSSKSGPGAPVEQGPLSTLVSAHGSPVANNQSTGELRSSPAPSTEQVSPPLGSRLRKADSMVAKGSRQGRPVHWTLSAGRTPQNTALPDPKERISYIQDLYTLPEDEAIPVLSQVLSEDGNPAVREEVVLALARIGSDSAILAMTDALGDEASAVRRQVLVALEDSGGNTTHLLGQMLYTEPDPDLRLEVVLFLAGEDTAAARALVKAAAEDPDGRVAELARNSVREWESEADGPDGQDRRRHPETEFLPHGNLTGQIRESLGSDDPGLRIAAVQKLQAAIPQEEAIPVLAAILAQDADAQVREEVVVALADIPEPAAVPVLEQALQDPAAGVRLRAVEALQVEQSRALQVIGQVLFSEPDPYLRREAIRMLTDDGSAAARALVEAAADDPNNVTRRMAQDAVKAWADTSMLPATVGMEDSSVQGRPGGMDLSGREFHNLGPFPKPASAYEAAADDGTGRAVERGEIRFLSEVLETDSDPYLREEAVISLGGIGGKAALEAMSAAMGDYDVAVRQRIIQELGRAGSGGVQLLGQVLYSEPDPDLRCEAVKLLAMRHEPAARALLEAAAGDPDESVRQTVDELTVTR